MDSLSRDMRYSEIRVAYYLEELGLNWIYQSPVFVQDENNNPKVWTPSFYIPKLGLYIEVCGWGKHINWEYQQKIYREHGVHVIFVHFYRVRKDWKSKRWKNFLIRRIREVEEKRHSEVMEVIDSL